MADKTPREAAAEARAKAADEAQRRAEEASLETFRRMETGKPTPTQRELNLANAGALDPAAPKEDDGSGPELVHTKVVLPADQVEQTRAGYRTREVQPARTAPAPVRPVPPPPAPAPAPEKK